MKTVMFIFILPICFALAWIFMGLLSPLAVQGFGFGLAGPIIQLGLFLCGGIYGYFYRKVTKS